MMSGGVPNDWTHNENVGPKHADIKYMYLCDREALKSLVLFCFVFFRTTQAQTTCS